MLALTLIGVAAFAAEGYTVDSVKGRVEKETSPGKWEAVTAGSTIYANTVVNVGLNSALVLKESGKMFTIETMGKNTVQNLVSAASGGRGVKIAGRAVNTQAGGATQSTSNISTASTRASTAAAGEDWVEE
jgi:hypothetical protein